MTGLTEALAETPQRCSLVYLDWSYSSAYLRNRPYLQMVAYAQAQAGCEIPFSFTMHGSEIVVMRHPAPPDWSSDLVWGEGDVTAKDLKRYEFLLLHGNPDDHRRAVRTLGVVPVTRDGEFRLYRIGRPASALQRNFSTRRSVAASQSS